MERLSASAASWQACPVAERAALLQRCLEALPGLIPAVAKAATAAKGSFGGGDGEET